MDDVAQRELDERRRAEETRVQRDAFRLDGRAHVDQRLLDRRRDVTNVAPKLRIHDELHPFLAGDRRRADPRFTPLSHGGHVTDAEY